MTASTDAVPKTAQEFSIGPMVRSMTANSLTVTCTAMATTHGQTSVNTMDSGRKTRCMETAFSLGPMVEPMKESTSTIASTVRVFSDGLRDVCTTVSGRTVSNMALVHSHS